MSHFLVMVIGDAPVMQLAPYHEFECTGHDDEFVLDFDQTDDYRSNYESYKQQAKEKKEKAIAGAENDAKEEEMSFFDYVTDYNGMKAVPFGEKPDLSGDHKYGYALLNESGEVDKVVRRTNPQAKWDWHVLGGRFSGLLLTKRGKVDQATKGEIDLEAMRKETRTKATYEYAVFAETTKDLPWPESWDSVRERFGDAIEGAREFYGEQPLVKAMRGNKSIGYFSRPEDYGQDADAYIENRVRGIGVPFAFVSDSKWCGRGDMGWFGMARNEQDKKTWDDEFWKMFDALPDDTLISMIDCHI